MLHVREATQSKIKNAISLSPDIPPTMELTRTDRKQLAGIMTEYTTKRQKQEIHALVIPEEAVEPVVYPCRYCRKIPRLAKNVT